MQLLKERILKDGIVKPGNILKVDSFLNHQMDITLINEIGKELKNRPAARPPTKIFTIDLPAVPHIFLMFLSFLQKNLRDLYLMYKCTVQRLNPSLTKKSMMLSYPRNSLDRKIMYF